ANLETLSARGVRFVEPGDGYLACGWIGKGRLAEPDDIVLAAERVLQPSDSLLGRLVIVTAGPTYEDIDDVRYIGNRSSGKMGYAVAAEAVRRGARVILVSGPSTLPPPAGAELVRVRSAEQMQTVVQRHAVDAHVVIMSAAVADYVPQRRATGKIEKTDAPLELSLVRTPDILAELGRARGERTTPVLVGFAAESGDPVARGREKLRRKGADMIVANDISSEGLGFDSDMNAATLITRDGAEPFSPGPKTALAATILDRAETFLAPITST
ncbi:MAG: bifunctional phosphopantothenoylcysteine decarboxylase/phosphopantothenate--cysteine ligase CoaBC, partial [Vicinamibacterales bacterium]